ncbi:MAG: hypothetical protein LUE98_18670 [Tannerellaceae bacterium]|nr:hypothetical protein [Tannerellaceae bacterium]
MKIRMIFSALCLAVLLGACSDKETDTTPEGNSRKAIYLKLSNGSGTKADEPTATGTSAPLLSAIIYFLDGSTNPVVEEVRTVGTDADITMAELEAGHEFMDIPSTVTQVYIVGNYNSSNMNGAAANFPISRGTLFSQVQAVTLQIEQVAYPRLADGTTAGQLLTVMDGRDFVQNYGSVPEGWSGEEDLTATDMYADVTVAPLNARIEIVQITYTGTSYRSFTLEGIYINNYFDTMPVSLDPMTDASYAPVNNGSDQTKYDVNSANFAYTNFSTLYDNPDIPVTVTGGTASITPANGVWAYHVFGSSSPVPHIILKLTNLVNSDGDSVEGARYVTVTGYIENGVEIGTFERNVIYKLANLAFTDADVSPVPEPEDVNLWVHVQVAPWETINVTPVF